MPEPLPEIAFDVFEQVEMTVVKVLACEPVKKSEKLLKFQLDDGTGAPRQILSGIAKYYRPEELIGKQVLAVVNFPPRQIADFMSEVLVLGTYSEGGVVLITPDKKVQNGDKLG